MAKQTTLQGIGLPGRLRSFIAKTPSVVTIFNTVAAVMYFPVKQENTIKFAVKQNNPIYFSPKHETEVLF